VVVIESPEATWVDVASVHVTTKVAAPAAVGVPEIKPVEAASVRPEGREPVTPHVYGAVPPVAVTIDT
jgi:hypothetical protein